MCSQQLILEDCVCQVFSIFGSHLSTVRSLAAEKREHQLYSGFLDQQHQLAVATAAGLSIVTPVATLLCDLGKMAGLWQAYQLVCTLSPLAGS